MSENLNQGQLEAVNCNENKILCLAGAGTGKTFTMLHRISKQVSEGVDPKSILALTFTNAAANNMRDRYIRDNGDIDVPEFRTFHSFCYHILTVNPKIRQGLGYSEVPSIIEDAEYKNIKMKVKSASGVKLTAKQISGEAIISPKDNFEYQVFTKYLRKTLLQRNLITFDQLCYDVCKLFVDNNPDISEYKERFKYIYADEFQDTDSRQMDFISSFTDAKIFIVGDALQALYAFRGADSSIIKNLASNPEWKTVRLTENFRSTKQICEFANNMSRYAEDAYRVEITSTKEGPEVIRDSQRNVTNYIDKFLADDTVTAILARTNKEVKMIQSKYLAEQSNFEKLSAFSSADKILKAAKDDNYAITFLSSYLRADQFAEFLRLKDLHPDFTVEDFIRWFQNTAIDAIASKLTAMKSIMSESETAMILFMKVLDMYEIDGEYGFDYISDIKTIDDAPTALAETYKAYKASNKLLYVGTIHSSKGLEYDNVILYGVGGRTFPLTNEDNLNLYYVGITRAKTNLCVLEDRYE